MPMKNRDIRCGLGEVQRAWLYSIAVLDFVETYERKLTCSGDGGIVLGNPRLGAFVWNDQDASKLFDVGIPVFYVRSYSSFSTQVVQCCKPLTHPNPLWLRAASPAYPVILPSSQAGCDAKFAAIRRASISCFDVASPFANMHLPGLYTTSYSLTAASGTIPNRIISPINSAPSSSSGVIRRSHDHLRHEPYAGERRAKGKAIGSFQPPPKANDRFREIASNEYLPSVVSAWRGSNLSINARHPDVQHTSGQREKPTTIVPDPVLFFGSEDRTKWQRRLQTWVHIRQNWIARSASVAPDPVSASTWKTLLTLGQLGPWKPDRNPQKAHEHEQEAATRLVHSIFASVDPTTPPFPIPTVEVSPSESQQLMRELSLINFRHQLRSLDSVADHSAPKPSTGMAAEELGLLIFNHRRERDLLLVEVFGTGGTVSSSTVCNILADDWHNRVKSLQALSKLMDTWPGEMKGELLWNQRDDANLPQLVGPGMEWEGVLVRRYVQTYYNHFGYPPILPRG
ncbi:hypothetical protein V5O48_015992 [Marasmius crinis-equi]|uniref:Uncharacterized protein n=1 Tax=Marasmius crinis-equi TaxID=585013 RepID=A0ABR3ET26_9AGAR